MKGGRNGLFSTFKQLKNKRFFFHDAHIGNGCASKTSWHFTCIPQRIAGPLEGQEHAPTETSRPLSIGPDPCGRFSRFHLSLDLGPTVLGHTYIPRLQSEGPIGTRFAPYTSLKKAPFRPAPFGFTPFSLIFFVKIETRILKPVLGY